MRMEERGRAGEEARAGGDRHLLPFVGHAPSPWLGPPPATGFSRAGLRPYRQRASGSALSGYSGDVAFNASQSSIRTSASSSDRPRISSTRRIR